MTAAARKRWKMLGQILLSKRLQSSEDHNDVSVMRFKTFGLYVRSQSTQLEEKQLEKDDGTWCLIEFTDFHDQNCNVLSIDIRLCSTKIDYSDLIGFNNTGNTCIWPSEEVLAYYCLKYKDLFKMKSVCELGGGMTCLAGLTLARSTKLAELFVTDGNEKSINNLKTIVESRRNEGRWSCPIEPKLLVWDKNFNEAEFAQRFDVLLTADCLFFENVHDDLCHMINFLLKDQGLSINFAPNRSKTLEKFVAAAERNSLKCSIYENYDEKVFEKHVEMKRINKNYSADLHYPILLVLRKK